MSHRRRRRSGMVLFCMNRASAMGCLSLRMCSPYRLFVLYHRSITAFAKVIQALPPLNTPARECGYSRRSFGFTVVATCILALLLDFVNQFRYCGLLHSSWFRLIVVHAITMQDFYPQDIPIPWHTRPHPPGLERSMRLASAFPRGPSMSKVLPCFAHNTLQPCCS